MRIVTLVTLLIVMCHGWNSFEINDLKNYQALFEKIGTLKIVNDFWKFEGHYDLKYLREATMVAGKLYTKLNLICELVEIKNVSRLYKACIFHGKEFVKQMRRSNQVLQEFKQQELYQNLQSEGEVIWNEEYMYHLNEFSKNQTYARILAAKNISILNGFDEQLYDLVRKIEGRIDELLEGRSDLILPRGNSTVIQFTGSPSELMFDIERLVLVVIKDLEEMITLINETLQCKLISMSEVQDLVKEAAYFPYEQLDLDGDGFVNWTEMSPLISMRTFCVDDKIGFEISIPLIDSKFYEISKITSIPMPIYGNFYAQIKFGEETFTIDNMAGTIFAISEYFLKTCSMIRSVYFCKSLPLNLEGNCLSQVYSEEERTDCLYEFREINKEFWKRTFRPNVNVFVTINKTLGSLTCNYGVNETFLLNVTVGKLSLRENCKFNTSTVALFTGNNSISHGRMEMKKVSEIQVSELKRLLMKEKFGLNYSMKNDDELKHLYIVAFIIFIIILGKFLILEVCSRIRRRHMDSDIIQARQLFISQNTLPNDTTSNRPRDVKRSQSFHTDA